MEIREVSCIQRALSLTKRFTMRGKGCTLSKPHFHSEMLFDMRVNVSKKKKKIGGGQKKTQLMRRLYFAAIV